MTNPLWAELMGQGNTSRLMEAEMISGQAEAQLLQILLKLSGGKDVLDIGTFTGYSSLAMAEAIPEDGTVVTLEREQEAADMAKANWLGSPHASKIESQVGEAHDLLQRLAAEGKSFDLVFLDVDKPGYFGLYQMLMEKNLLKVKGLLVVDNVMYKGEELSGTELTKNGQGAQALNQGLLDDPRVQQVMLPLSPLARQVAIIPEPRGRSDACLPRVLRDIFKSWEARKADRISSQQFQKRP